MPEIIHYKSIDPVEGEASWMLYHDGLHIGYITRRSLSHDLPYVFTRTLHGAKGFSKTRGDAAQELIAIHRLT